jgi:hypothetical protein
VREKDKVKKKERKKKNDVICLHGAKGYDCRVLEDYYDTVLTSDNRSIAEIPAPIPICLPQIPHAIHWCPLICVS